jgi:magnesium-transporting ATPase (P-type)
VVVAGMFYLFNSRFLLQPVLSRSGLTGNPHILLAIATCACLQIAYTHLPLMQAIFNSTDLSLLEWGKVLVAGLLVFCVAELEKFVVRRSRLAAHLGLA